MTGRNVAQGAARRLSRRDLHKASLAAGAAMATASFAGRGPVTATQATPAAGADLDTRFTDLDAFIEQRMTELKVPGVALGVIAGDPETVAPRALELFLRQHETAVDGQADVVVFGLPDLGPASVGTAQNPILSAHLALGTVANLFTESPLLRKGGVLVFANPLAPVFDRKAHLPHEEFYERVLRLERDPQAIHERFEPYFAGRPEFVANYQRRNAFHGAHPLHSWYGTQSARRHAGRIIVAHGDPRACARLGLTHAVDIEEAIDKAYDFLEMDEPQISVLDLPPPFWVRVR